MAKIHISEISYLTVKNLIDTLLKDEEIIISRAFANAPEISITAKKDCATTKYYLNSSGQKFTIDNPGQVLMALTLNMKKFPIILSVPDFPDKLNCIYVIEAQSHFELS